MDMAVGKIDSKYVLNSSPVIISVIVMSKTRDFIFRNIDVLDIRVTNHVAYGQIFFLDHSAGRNCSPKLIQYVCTVRNGSRRG